MKSSKQLILYIQSQSIRQAHIQIAEGILKNRNYKCSGGGFDAGEGQGWDGATGEGGGGGKGVGWVFLLQFKNKRMRKFSQDLQLLNEMECDKADLLKIQKQRQRISQIQSTLQKKDQQIEKLKSLLEKYQQYQQKYTSLKVELTERAHLNTKKENQCRMLRKQVEELMKEQGEYSQKIRQYELERQGMIRERHSMQAAHKEIETTFKEYQAQFRKRQNALTFDLERAYQQIKETNSRIDSLEMIAEEKKALEVRLKEQQRVRTEERQSTPKVKESIPSQKEQQVQGLLEEIDNLRRQLISKEEELTANRVLNYQLTVEYDSSINSICSLQTELSGYRRENNQLKKIVSLMREQGKCKEIQQKYTLRNRTQFVTPMSDEESQSQSDLPTSKHYIPKTSDIVSIAT